MMKSHTMSKVVNTFKLRLIMPLKIYSEPSNPSQPEIKNVIAIAAGKGGVGKSTLTVNIALALQQMGFSVGIMDTDIYGPSIRKMLPEDCLPGQRGNTIIPAKCHGIQMISMAYFRKENESAAIRAPIANGIITQFIKNVMWGSLDYLLIDFPPGTGDIQLTLSQHANLSGAIMVTTPQEVATLDVKKAMHLFEQVKIPIIGIVENMSYYYHASTRETVYLFGKGGGKKLAEEAGVPYLEGIPVDPLICECGDQGKSIFSLEDVTAKHIKERFITLAQQVIEQARIVKEETKENMQSFELIWKEM